MSAMGMLRQLTLRMVSIISMTVYRNRVVKAVLRLVGLGLFTVALLFSVGLWYSTAHGYMSWWFSASSQVAVDGVRSGFLPHQPGPLGGDDNSNRCTSEPVVFGRAVWQEIFDSLRRLASTTTSGVSNRRREPTLFVFQQQLRLASSR